MTGNGSCYRSHLFKTAIKHIGARSVYTRPYTPRTNGKAERFIQTSIKEWAYEQAYQISEERNGRLEPMAGLLQSATATHRPQLQTADLKTGWV